MRNWEAEFVCLQRRLRPNKKQESTQYLVSISGKRGNSEMNFKIFIRRAEMKNFGMLMDTCGRTVGITNWSFTARESCRRNLKPVLLQKLLRTIFVFSADSAMSRIKSGMRRLLSSARIMRAFPMLCWRLWPWACPALPQTASPGGARALIQDGVNGFLVPPGSKERMAEQICAIIDESDTADRIVVNGKKLAKRIIQD